MKVTVNKNKFTGKNTDGRRMVKEQKSNQTVGRNALAI
jgi:hypothetical protein